MPLPAVVFGLLLVAAALVALESTGRTFLFWLNGDDYIRTELKITDMIIMETPGDRSIYVYGIVAATGEEIRVDTYTTEFFEFDSPSDWSGTLIKPETARGKVIPIWFAQNHKSIFSGARVHYVSQFDAIPSGTLVLGIATANLAVLIVGAGCTFVGIRLMTPAVRDAMHRVSDRHLPEPFRSWIDRDVPLPPGVTVLPRTVDVMGSVSLVAMVLTGCVVIGLPMSLVFWPFLASIGEWPVVGLIATVSVGFLVWNLNRLCRTIGARRDQKAGVLRQGVLVGPDGVLVRLTPGRCYPVPMDRFVRAEEWSGGGENSLAYLRIVTRDGPIDIRDHDITADAADMNRAVAAAREAGRWG